MTADPSPDDLAGADPLPPATGDDLLPPVEPPSAGFIIQLFVVPAVIVMIVVGVWIVVSWLVHRTTVRPEDLIQGLEGSSVARWQRASELADLLRNERFAKFRANGKAAAQLAAILDREIDAAESGQRMDEQSVTLRFFLCRALGEFRVDEGTDVLLKAAATNRDPRETIVRRGALQAIAVRAFNLSQLDPPRSLADPDVEPTLFRLASDEDGLVRSETAYALGQVGTPGSIARLEAMVDDAHADTRYNAAVALAQHGNAAAIDTLAEMLDPQETSSVDQEPNEAARFFKRSLIMTNALEAVEKLASDNPTADFSPVVAVLDHVVAATPADLEQARIRPGVVPRAKETLELLRSRQRP
jgi:HEAT repeat protein